MLGALATTGLFAAALIAPASAAAKDPRPVLHMDDGIEWAFGQDADENTPTPGDRITTTLRIGNGGTGSGGYERKVIGAKPMLSGDTTELSFPVDGLDDDDDDSALVNLPFKFRFGGIPYKSVRVSTNGWVSFGGPGLDYYDDAQRSDFRGTKTTLGRFFRGVMPYFSDLDASNNGAVSPTTVSKTVSGDEKKIAFAWDVGYCCTADPPERTFEVVLFKDGRFRYDYPGTNDPGGPNLAMIGLMGGNGASNRDVFRLNINDVPTKSLLYTPQGGKAGKAPKGTVTTNLPAGSDFMSGPTDNACHLKRDPTTNHDGTVKCGTPKLGRGDSKTIDVAWAAPDNPFNSSLANTQLKAKYVTAGKHANDDDEAAFANDTPSDIPLTATNTYNGPVSPTVGDDMDFDVNVFTGGSDGLFAPVLKFKVPDGARYRGTDVPACNDGPSGTGGGTVTCHLPYFGLNAYPGVFTIRPTHTGTFTTRITGDAANAAAPEHANETSPAVAP